MTRLFACLAVIVVVAACQNETHPAFSPVPSPSPHRPATAAVLQPAEVPTALTVCPGSGPMDVNLGELAVTNPALSLRESAQWQQLVGAGAVSAAVSLYAAAPSACATELGATSSVKAAASVVVAFADPGEADRAWGAGIFGFAPPATGEVAPGVTRGSATGLGESSFVYVLAPVRLASWHRSVFVALVVLTNLDQPAFQTATAAVDARLN